MNSGFHSDMDDICTLLGYYATWSSNSIPTFRDSLSVLSSRVKKSKKKAGNTWVLSLYRERCGQ